MKGWPTEKGPAGTMKRAALLPFRYGLTPGKIRSQLQLMVSSLHELEVTPTIGITACLLDSYPEVLEDLRGVDVAIHGYYHLAYSSLSPDGQARDLDRAIAAFENGGLPSKGFRGPHLKTNPATIALLESRGFAYDSSVPRMILPGDGALWDQIASLARLRYGEVDTTTVFPTPMGSLIEIPVSLPDDELIVDGMGIRKAAPMKRILQSMLQKTAETNSLLVLQIHPERYGYVTEAVDAVVKSATDDGAWKASLSEIARWTAHRGQASRSWPNGHHFAVAVTGDLDRLRLQDFAPRIGKRIR